MLKSALLLTAGIVIGAGAIQGINAAGGSPVYNVYEANVTDEAAYTKALPDVEKVIKENGGVRIAGGFNKAKLVNGKTPVGNRYVVIRWDNEAAFTQAQEGGIKAWLEKNAPADYRQVLVEGVDATK